jgi:hypothetical protein
VLAWAGGNQSKAAAALGINRATLRKKLALPCASADGAIGRHPARRLRAPIRQYGAAAVMIRSEKVAARTMDDANLQPCAAR